LIVSILLGHKLISFNSGLVFRKRSTPGRATCTLPPVWHGNSVRGNTAANVCFIFNGEFSLRVCYRGEMASWGLC